MQIDRTPCTIFTIQQLIADFFIIVIRKSTIRTRPVLNHIPICSFTTVTSGYYSLISGCWIHFTNDIRTLFGKFLWQRTFVLQSPHHYRRRITTLLYPLTKQCFKVITEFRRIIPYMCRELRPENNSILVPVILIRQIMRLVSITESIKASCFYLLYTRSNLFTGKSMRLSELMFVFTNTVNKNRFTIQSESLVAIFTKYRPAYRTDTVRSSHLVSTLTSTFYN